MLEPARLAPLGGTTAAVLALAYYLFREWMGLPMSAATIIVRVSLSFVVGYAATGILVWYVLQVLWRERPVEAAKPVPEGTPDKESKK